VGTGVAVAVGLGVAVGASVAETVAMGVAAGPQAESKKAKTKKQSPTCINNFFTTKGTKFHKGPLKNLCDPLSFVLFVSFVLKVFFFTWPIQ
jgi:hypothetical protein